VRIEKLGVEAMNPPLYVLIRALNTSLLLSGYKHALLLKAVDHGNHANSKYVNAD
jgi:hypothetical protein